MYFCKLKALTLDQWGRLDITLSKLLRGSAWDELEPSVDEKQLAAEYCGGR